MIIEPFVAPLNFPITPAVCIKFPFIKKLLIIVPGASAELATRIVSVELFNVTLPLTMVVHAEVAFAGVLAPEISYLPESMIRSPPIVNDLPALPLPFDICPAPVETTVRLPVIVNGLALMITALAG